MRVVLLAEGDATANPRTMSLAASLRSVGHDVTVVCGGAPSRAAGVRRVPTRVPAGRGAIGGILRRVQPKAYRRRSHQRRLVAAASELDPQLVYAANESAVLLAGEVAAETGGAVVRDPRYPSAGERDMVHLAPGDSRLSSSPAGPGMAFHTSGDDRPRWHPQPGRHAGRKIVIAYRPTGTTPARYLHAALARAGIDVEHVTDRLDRHAISPDTAAVVIVESPYPALGVTGTKPAVPVLLWAHHGEHHTDAHLRLIARYGVDGVLLAHSWHLAHRYPVPVHRFPFAVAPEMLDGTRRWDDRRYDLAFVGSTGQESAHRSRRKLIDDASSVVPDERRVISSAMTPDEMASAYGDARIVLNEGGTRHHPITMRVFEAIGSGAALLTTDAPGLELLFAPREHYRSLHPPTVGATIAAMLKDPATARMAESAYHSALGRHTYDHRVDELLAIAEATPRRDQWTPEAPSSAVAQAIADDVEVATIAAFGLPGLRKELPLHAVWNDPHPGTRRYDAVALGSGWQGPASAACRDAVRYIYTEAGTLVPPELDSLQSVADRSRIDLKAPGYRIENTP